MRTDPLRLPAGSDGLRDAVLARGCYSREENQRIFEKWFTGTRPRDRLIAELDREIHLREKTICDVGCGYGKTS